MNKLLIAAAISSLFAASAFADPSYGNVTTTPYTGGYVNSQSQASASSHDAGSAFSATQSGAFATFGQVSQYTGAPSPSTGGTASVAGFTQTSEYITSQSQTSGEGRASSSSWNSAGAGVGSYSALPSNDIGYGAASGTSNSYVGAEVSTSSHDDKYQGATQVQGNSAVNTGLYSATDSAVSTPSYQTVNGVSVPVTTIQTETSAMAQNVSTQTNNTVYNNAGTLTNVNNVGNGENTVYNYGGTASVAN